MSSKTPSLDHLRPALRELLERLPREPGVYLLVDRRGEIIYVGKAKNLSARVRSYFIGPGDGRAFVPLLARMLGDVQTIVTHNEKEALLLENNLIKKHKPRFNVMMRDDKSFLVLRLDAKASYPRLEVTRRILDDGARYFGPYHSASSCRETLRLVNRHFRLRTCTDRVMNTRQRACLQYQIGRCPAPCVIEVDPAEYRQQVDDVSLFLRGSGEALVSQLGERMQAAAQRLDFERAAQLRDQIAAIERTLEKQEVVGRDLVDQDVFAYYREGDAVDIVVLLLREGKLMGRRSFSFSGQEFPDEELISSFINQYYDGGAGIPRQLILGLELEDRVAKAQWLSERRGQKVELIVPQRGHKRQLLQLAARNARSNFVTRRERDADLEEALAKLQRRLRLVAPPRHIECYDISQLQGRQVVASMVVMRDAQLDPSSYRHFRVRAATDDFAAIYEVLARRLRRAARGWELPDLIVIDGGKGQLSAALAALSDATLPEGVSAPTIVALAKERAPDAAGQERPERVFLPQVKDPIRLSLNTSELYLLTRLRDEAHRFAISHHRRLRRRQTLRSSLDEIPGVGPKRKAQLLRSLGSLRRIRAASVEELKAVPGMTLRAAEAVAEYFSAGGEAATEREENEEA